MDALIIECSATRMSFWFGHGCYSYRMLLEHKRYYGLGMDATVTVCSWNTNVIVVWAWVLQCRYALGTRTLLWFGHGCSSDRMLLEHERYYGLGMDALIIECSATRMSFWFGHGCYSYRMLLEHKRYYGLGMDATVTVCSWSTNVIRFGHGCSHHRVLSNTNVIMVWAWMLQ